MTPAEVATCAGVAVAQAEALLDRLERRHLSSRMRLRDGQGVVRVQGPYQLTAAGRWALEH